MTTSILSPENSAPAVETLEVLPVKNAGYTSYRIKHTLPSRFAFLTLCSAIILSALAFGTVHYWTQAVFFLGAVAILTLWIADSWILGSFRVSKNVLQLALLGLLVVGLVQLLPLRTPENAGTLPISLTRSLSYDPYATRLVVVQLTSLLIYFFAALVLLDTPKRLRLLVRTITIFGFFLAIFGLTQSIISPNKVYWFRELAQSTAFGPFINRHHFAGYMELTLALPLGLLFSGAVVKEKRFIYLFVAGLMGVALMMTNSRGGIISLVAEILFLAATMGFKRRHQKKGESKTRKPRIKSAGHQRRDWRWP